MLAPRQLLEHNNQIEELQRAWELAKADDEGRGAGAADVKRWAGIRHVTEAKELLKALFRTACDHKYGTPSGAAALVCFSFPVSEYNA